MEKRRRQANIRLSEHERSTVSQAFFESGHEGTFTSYCRDVLMGNRIHPNFEHHTAETPKKPEFRNVGEVKGPDETRQHIAAIVLAAQMLQVKTDPDIQKIMADNHDEFAAMVDHIRGYKYDDETGMKSPLSGHKPQGSGT